MYTNPWDETYPPGTDSADQIDDVFHYWAIAIRERINSIFGTSDFATADPYVPAALAFRGANPFIQIGTASFKFLDSTGIVTLGTVLNSGDYTAARHIISTSNLISNGSLVFNANSAKILPGSVSLLFRNFADSATNLTIADDGTINVANVINSPLLNITNTALFKFLTVNAGQAWVARDNVGNVTGATAIDWNGGNVQAITLTGNAVLTFNNPQAGAFYTLEIAQGGAGTNLITWPGSVKWPNAVAPTLSGTVGKIDMISFYYNGTNYLGAPGGFTY